jgi:DnaK suppressor protein
MIDLTRSDTKALRQRLTDCLDELNTLSASGKASRDPLELDQSSLGRLSRMDAMQGQAMATEGERRRSIEHQRIAQALSRIEEGNYRFYGVSPMWTHRWNA